MLGRHFLISSHIAASAPLSLVNLWQTTPFFSFWSFILYMCISDVWLLCYFHDICSPAFICLALLVDGFPSLPFKYIYKWFFFQFESIGKCLLLRTFLNLRVIALKVIAQGCRPKTNYSIFINFKVSIDISSTLRASPMKAVKWHGHQILNEIYVIVVWKWVELL